VVTASHDKTARLWDARSGASLAVLEGHQDWVTSAAFSPDGQRVVTASHDKTARLWDARSGASLAVLEGHKSGVYSAAFSPDSERVVTASSDKTARLWDARSGASLAVLEGHKSGVYSAAFSPDSERVVTASSDKTARLWDARTGAPLTVLEGHKDSVSSAAFSPDGERVLTASEDNTGRLWDARTGAPLAALEGHASAVRSAAFSPDGERAVTASEDNSARLWELSNDRSDWIIYAAIAATRELTGDERTEFFIAHPRKSLSPARSREDVQLSDCDRLAAHPLDPQKRSTGITLEAIEDDAVTACRAAVASQPNEPRFLYQLARALLKSKHKEAVDLLQRAAEQGYAIAHYSLALVYEKGWGELQPDVEMAIRHSRAAWDAGIVSVSLARIYSQLAERYERGDGIERNLHLALFHYIIATRLHDEADEFAGAHHAQLMRYRRASLARNMPVSEVVKIATESAKWMPSVRN
jgi:TPR repeat protein